MKLIGFGRTNGLEFDVSGVAVTVGRDKTADFYLPMNFVSRHHGVIFRMDNEWYIRDLKSFNGTFVNQAEVDGTTRLNDGDRIRFGDAEFYVEMESINGLVA